jgi:hypothetical protein
MIIVTGVKPLREFANRAFEARDQGQYPENCNKFSGIDSVSLTAGWNGEHPILPIPDVCSATVFSRHSVTTTVSGPVWKSNQRSNRSHTKGHAARDNAVIPVWSK